ncbi:MAG: hypothetical protein ABI680_17355 [Chthoniobacteraceae bacterium]
MLYGAAQFSKDVDFVLLSDEANYERLLAAMEDLEADRIAVPRFDPAVLERGHAVHFRCQAPGAEGLRVDVMTRLRDLPPFQKLWSRRTTIHLPDGETCEILAVEDLITAKKTQRAKDWPVIDALVEGHYRSLHDEPTEARIQFWLRESRTPERLIELTARFPAETASLLAARPLLVFASQGDLDELRTAIDAEIRAEQEKDRRYWEPLKREIEEFRRAERQG